MQNDRPVSPSDVGYCERPRPPAACDILAAGPGTDAAIHAKFGEASVARSEIHLRAHSILHGKPRSSVRGGVTRTTCRPAPPQTPHPHAGTRAPSFASAPPCPPSAAPRPRPRGRSRPARQDIRTAAGAASPAIVIAAVGAPATSEALVLPASLSLLLSRLTLLSLLFTP